MGPLLKYQGTTNKSDTGSEFINDKDFILKPIGINLGKQKVLQLQSDLQTQLMKILLNLLIKQLSAQIRKARILIRLNHRLE